MNEYSVDFKLKIVKMILNDHISKKDRKLFVKNYNLILKVCSKKQSFLLLSKNT